MNNFTLKRHSVLSQEQIFTISTDVKNFHLIMPDYFKSLDIIKQNNNEKIVYEKISFLGIPMKIKTRHVIKHPNIHEVHIFSGPTKGTRFIESYVKSGNGTIVTIDVHLNFNGILKLFSFLKSFVAKKMSQTMDDFIISAEKFHLSGTIQS
ncbi:SRPBCC family protein [Nitrosopumilus sp. b2]|uniref:SRPBCC family protein n=1 Tax=Nitrosopumilus sp. b2 TaxID=2109908 RepID=UPI0015F6DB07|nr:SRPBCC family protein [Nitrosopumilus sp. b2]KAF6244305.1 hypothetical protein C6989_08445 [Nitrosopumilus sp. b2]